MLRLAQIIFSKDCFQVDFQPAQNKKRETTTNITLWVSVNTVMILYLPLLWLCILLKKGIQFIFGVKGYSGAVVYSVHVYMARTYCYSACGNPA